MATKLQKWKLHSINYDVEMKTFSEQTNFFGRCTKEKAIELMGELFPNFWFTPKASHGFGGYWVDCDGNTKEILPSF